MHVARSNASALDRIMENGAHHADIKFKNPCLLDEAASQNSFFKHPKSKFAIITVLVQCAKSTFLLPRPNTTEPKKAKK